MRGEELTTEEFLPALGDAGVAEQLSVVISGHQEITPADGTRGSGGADDIEVDVPAPGDGNGQVLLYAAEDGSLSWHLAVDVPPDGRSRTAAGERRTYRVPKAVVPPDEQDAAAHRGIVGAIGKKVLKVLVFPLVDPVLGKVGDHFARKWEGKNRLNRVRWMTVAGYRSGDAPSFTDADWARLREGRALLLVHGTFSTPHGGFGSIPEATMSDAAREVRRPGGGVRAPQRLGHAEGERRGTWPAWCPMASRSRSTWSRTRAVGWSAARSPRPRHSTYAGSSWSPHPTPAPLLADRKHLSDFLDRITDLAQFVPDNGVTDTLGLVFAVVKQAGGRRGRRSRRADVDEPCRGLPRRAQRPTGTGRRAPCDRRRLRAAAAVRLSPGSPATRAPTWCSRRPTTTSSCPPRAAGRSTAPAASRSRSAWCWTPRNPSTTTRSSGRPRYPSTC